MIFSIASCCGFGGRSVFRTFEGIGVPSSVLAKYSEKYVAVLRLSSVVFFVNRFQSRMWFPDE